MSAVPPRHLAPRPPGRRRLLPAVAVAVVVIATGTLAVLAGGGGAGDRDGRAIVSPPPATPDPGAATSTAPPTTAPPARSGPESGPARPPRPIPGNLLSNGDFELGLAGWGTLGDARLQRVPDAHSGAWAALIGAGEGGTGHRGTGAGGASGRPGIAIPLQVQARQGRTYQGSAWVRASRPGIEATLALREYGAGSQSSADVTGVSLPDSQWHEVAVVHQSRIAGAQLALEISGGGLEPGDLILVDEVGVTLP